MAASGGTDFAARGGQAQREILAGKELGVGGHPLDELGPEVLITVSEFAGFGEKVPFPQAVAIDETGDALAVAAD